MWRWSSGYISGECEAIGRALKDRLRSCFYSCPDAFAVVREEMKIIITIMIINRVCQFFFYLFFFFKLPVLPRAPALCDFPLKKVPVMSYRLRPIFDFHSSLTKPPGMLLFKDAIPSPQTTATAS